MANSKFSTFVYKVIDLAGINSDIQGKRIKCMNQVGRLTSETFKPDDYILTGSTSEGVSPLFLSDLDTMVVQGDVICVEEANADTSCKLDILVAEYDNMPPGYVKVRHKYKSNDNTEISLLLSLSYLNESASEAPIISSKLFNKYGKPSNDTLDNLWVHVNVQLNGPGCTLTADSSSLRLFVREFDFVNAIRFYNSSILTEWSSRARHYDWPTAELIHDVSTMEEFILPVGEKKSDTEHLEWRISHVTIEKRLLNMFNSIQSKLYVVLKLFAKNVFSSVSKSFSSYMVKNVVLWMAEMNPGHHYTPDLFIAQLLKSFHFIKHCLINNHLPSYMIPKKNLIAGRIFGHEKHEFISLLSSLIDEGELVIYKLPNLAVCLNYVSIHPVIFTKCCMWRHCVESLSLSLLPSICTSWSCLSEKTVLDVYNRSFDHPLVYAVLQNQQLLSKGFMLFELLMLDYLERFPNATFDDLMNTCFKRLQFAMKCWFL